MKSKPLDIRHNCLTDKSLSHVKKTSQFCLKLEDSDNYFKETKDSEAFLEDVPKSPTLMYPQAFAVGGFLQIQDNEANTRLKTLEEQSIKTQQQLEKTSKEVEATTKAVRALTDSVKQNTKRFDKVFNQIEVSISRTIRERFPKFTPVKKEDLDDCELKNHETDILLLNKDGTVLIIGEVKHDVGPTAFGQLQMRIDAFELSDLEPPSRLRNVQKVVGVIGGDICSDQMREIAKKRGYVIITKKDEYVIENEDLLKEYIMSVEGK